MRIYNSALELIGRTPLVKINTLNDSEANIFAKVEYFNPAASIKDRVALSMIEQAQREGLINKDTVIINGKEVNTNDINEIKKYERFLLINVIDPNKLSPEELKKMNAPDCYR